MTAIDKIHLIFENKQDSNFITARKQRERLR